MDPFERVDYGPGVHWCCKTPRQKRRAVARAAVLVILWVVKWVALVLGTIVAAIFKLTAASNKPRRR